MLLWGGRGSSKSNFAAKKLIYSCLSQKYFRYILIRNTYGTIKDSQYQTIKDIIYEWGLQSLFKFKENPLEIHCINGNIFYARGCDDVTKIKSIKDPSGAWYEEGNEITESDFITITTSIRTGKAEYLQEILSFNPECEGAPEDFWINKWFFNGRKTEKCFTDNLEIKYKDEVLKTQFTAHHSTYPDNKWINKEFKAQMEQLLDKDPYYYDVYCKGIWGQRLNQNPFANHYSPKKHESQTAIFRPEKQLIISIDFNLNPFAVTFWHYWRDNTGEHIHCFDELEISNGSIPAMIDAIKLRYPNHLHSARLTGDSMGKNRSIEQRDNSSLYDNLLRGLGMTQYQLQCKHNPTHENSREQVNNVLFKFNDFKINPVNCPNLCRDMKNVQCDAFGQILKKDRKDVNQRADYLDTCRSVVHNILADFK